MLLKQLNYNNNSKYAISLLVILTWHYVVNLVSAASFAGMGVQPDAVKNIAPVAGDNNLSNVIHIKQKIIAVHLNQNSSIKNDSTDVKTKESNSDGKVKEVNLKKEETAKPIIKNEVTQLDGEDAIGALGRGIWVAAGISLLLIMYIGWKTYKQRNKRTPLVRKYGIRARRSDIEMEPLHSDDDEEDETVFDMKNVNN